MRKKRYELMLTLECNMRCNYCFIDNFTSEYTGYGESIEQINEDLAKNDCEEYYLEILGGEITLYPERITEALNLLDTTKLTRITFITNGLIYSQDIIDLMKASDKFKLAISWQGFTGEREEEQRVLDNIERYIEELGANKVYAYYILTYDSASLIQETYNHLKSAGIKAIMHSNEISIEDLRPAFKILGETLIDTHGIQMYCGGQYEYYKTIKRTEAEPVFCDILHTGSVSHIIGNEFTEEYQNMDTLQYITEIAAKKIFRWDLFKHYFPNIKDIREWIEI